MPVWLFSGTSPGRTPKPLAFVHGKRELLDGLLGADLVGFHTQSHCNNFLETVDRTLESRVNWERFSVERGSHLTQVRPFPISVAFPKLTNKTRLRPALSTWIEGLCCASKAWKLPSWASAWSEWITRRESLNDSGGWNASWKSIRALSRPILTRADRRPEPHPHQALSRSSGGCRGRS